MVSLFEIDRNIVIAFFAKVFGLYYYEISSAMGYFKCITNCLGRKLLLGVLYTILVYFCSLSALCELHHWVFLDAVLC